MLGMKRNREVQATDPETALMEVCEDCDALAEALADALQRRRSALIAVSGHGREQQRLRQLHRAAVDRAFAAAGLNNFISMAHVVAGARISFSHGARVLLGLRREEPHAEAQ
ncbi:hypothetical protein [Phenylobacterium sp.]|uniref:hypothetical protein n=1 Tax=Phenylobacterium sp. TaxID=1871053 RepID=UPI0035618CF4